MQYVITECLKSSQYFGPVGDPQVYLDFDNYSCAKLRGGAEQVDGWVCSLLMQLSFVENNTSDCSFLIKYSLMYFILDVRIYFIS